VLALDRLLRALADNEVAFIVVGGVAARAHGSALFTQDLDIVYERDARNYTALVKALRRYEPYLRGAPPGLPFVWSEATLKAGLNFTLVTTLGDLDLLGEITGGGRYGDLLPHAERRRMFGRDTLVLGLEWLVRVKRAAGRPKDLQAIAELEAIREEGTSG
jgi:hypothetical protein